MKRALLVCIPIPTVDLNPAHDPTQVLRLGLMLHKFAFTMISEGLDPAWRLGVSKVINYLDDYYIIIKF